MNKIEQGINEISDMNADGIATCERQQEINCKILQVVRDLWEYMKRCEPDMN